jgi:hypothetical protein
VKIHYLGKEFPKYLAVALFLLGSFAYAIHNNATKSREMRELKQQMEIQNQRIEALQNQVTKVEKRPPSVIHHHHIKKIVIKKYILVKPLNPLPPLDFSSFLLPLPTMSGIQDATSFRFPPLK